MSSKNITIGIDLGDRKHSACVLSAGGEILAETTITNYREGLTAFAQRHSGATFVMETGTHSPWVSRLLESLGHPVIVANARKLFVGPFATAGTRSPHPALRSGPRLAA